MTLLFLHQLELGCCDYSNLVAQKHFLEDAAETVSSPNLAINVAIKEVG